MKASAIFFLFAAAAALLTCTNDDDDDAVEILPLIEACPRLDETPPDCDEVRHQWDIHQDYLNYDACAEGLTCNLCATDADCVIDDCLPAEHVAEEACTRSFHAELETCGLREPCTASDDRVYAFCQPTTGRCYGRRCNDAGCGEGASCSELAQCTCDCDGQEVVASLFEDDCPCDGEPNCRALYREMLITFSETPQPCGEVNDCATIGYPNSCGGVKAYSLLEGGDAIVEAVNALTARMAATDCDFQQDPCEGDEMELVCWEGECMTINPDYPPR